jgi:hypothetical protein
MSSGGNVSRDAPGRLVAWAGALLGARRADWAQAMTAELGRLEGGSLRWSFAWGCVRASVVTGLTDSRLGRVVVNGVAGAALICAGLVAWGLVRYPGVISGPGTWLALAAFVGVLGCYLVAAVAIGPALGRAGPSAMRIGVLGGVAVTASWMLVGLAPGVLRSASAAGALLVAGPVLAFGVGAAGAARDRTHATGFATAAVAGLLAGLLTFMLWVGDTVATGGRPYDAGMVRDFHTSGAKDLATFAVNDNLGSAMVLLVLVPLMTVVVGFLGTLTVTTRAAGRAAKAAEPPWPSPN